MPDLIHDLEALNGKTLSTEEQNDVEMWQKGRALSHQVNSPGWDVVLEILQGYALNETKALLAIDPSETARVASGHAVAFAAARIYNLFCEDVQRCVDFSQHTPQVIEKGMNHLPVPPQSL